jgi:hypothetical protein
LSRETIGNLQKSLALERARVAGAMLRGVGERWFGEARTSRPPDLDLTSEPAGQPDFLICARSQNVYAQ